ncbi:MAG: transporter [Firmicutes bacterium]|nr:transporter [Bacillota bacterium]
MIFLIILGGIKVKTSVEVSQLFNVQKLHFSEKLGYGIGVSSVNLIYNVISTYLLFFYTNVYGLKPADAATMFLLVRIIDAVASPIYGTWVDKRTTKYGKYRGYLLYLSIPYAVLSILCFYSPDASYAIKLVYAYSTYIGLSLLNTFLSPLGAMPAAMTRDNNEIAEVNAYGIFCSNVGGMLISFGVPLLVTQISGAYTGADAQSGWFFTMSIFAIVGLIGLLLGFKLLEEHYYMSTEATQSVSFKDIFVQIHENKPFAILLIYLVIAFIFMTIVNSVGSYYVTYNMNKPYLLKYFNLLAALPSFILVPLFPWFKRRLGRKGLMLGFSVVLILGLLIMYISNPENIPLVMVGKLLTSVGMIVITGYMWAFQTEAVNYGEWKTGKRENAIISSVCSFTVAAGMAIGGVIPGYILNWIGFDASIAMQSATTLQGITMMQSIIPTIFIILGMIVFAFYPITDQSMNQMSKEIDDRKARNEL